MSYDFNYNGDARGTNREIERIFKDEMSRQEEIQAAAHSVVIVVIVVVLVLMVVVAGTTCYCWKKKRVTEGIVIRRPPGETQPLGPHHQ